MNYLKAGIFFFIIWIIQTTLLWRIWPFGSTPHLLLCAVVCFAYLYSANYAFVYAIAFGLLLDIQVQSLFGVSALLLVLCCIPAWSMRFHFNPERILPCVIAALIATFINVFGLWAIYVLFGTPASIILTIRELPELLISQAVICLVLHIIFVRTIIKDRRDRRYIGGVV